MNRRHFLFGLSGAVALLGSARPGRAECGTQTAREFVEALYQKQARLQAEKTPMSEEDFNETFSSGLRRLMTAPRQTPNSMPDGPILNALFGYGVLPGAEVTIGKVTLATGEDTGPATIAVRIKHRGEQHRLLVHVINQDDDYRIANIIHDSGKSLLAHYQAITRA